MEQHNFHPEFGDQQNPLPHFSQNCAYCPFIEASARPLTVCYGIDWYVVTWEKAMAIAQSMESAINVCQLQGVRSMEELNEAHKGGLSTPCTPRSEKSAATWHGCGEAGHVSAKCRQKWAMGYSCGDVCHSQAVCKSKPFQDSPQTTCQQQHPVRQVMVGEEACHLFTLPSAQTKPWNDAMEINIVPLEIEVDTGASLSIVAKETYQCHWSQRELEQSQLRLRTFSGEPLEVMGSLPVVVQHSCQEARLSLVIV